jgi:hypothetical protein
MNFFLFLIIVTATLTHSAPSPSPQPVAFRVGPLRFDRPESWRWVPPSGSFRAAQLEKKSPDGTPLTLTFSRFSSGEGGSTQANIDRWVAQFTTSNPPRTEIKKGSEGTLTLFHLEGTLRAGTPGGPTRDLPQALLLGAILESQGEQVVMKLVGPAQAVSSAEKDFLRLAYLAIGLTP